MLKTLAPAKINLVLEVLGKRNDGYHEIRSIVQVISLCDTLSFELDDVISLECDEPTLQTPDNLVVRAAELLREVSGSKKGAKIRLEKRIPCAAGFAGGSSDAAATLLALNRLWNLEYTASDLVPLAANLGSDVPFFIHGGVALVEGRGEKVTPLEAWVPCWFVLLVPSLPKMPNKTQQLYSLLDTLHFSEGQFVDRAMSKWSQGEGINASLMFNVFERVACRAFPGLETYWRRFAKAGVTDIHLVGSGPALFTLVSDSIEAEEVCRRLHQQGIEAYVASTIVPEAI